MINAATNKVRGSGSDFIRFWPKEGLETSVTCEGASTVAGVAEVSAITGGLNVVAGTVTGDSCATGVSTVGERVGSAVDGTSSGLTGLPAATDSFDATAGLEVTIAGDDSA